MRTFFCNRSKYVTQFINFGNISALLLSCPSVEKQFMEQVFREILEAKEQISAYQQPDWVQRLRLLLV